MARILILGGGFAAVSAAETLAPVAREHKVIVVSRTTDLTFFPAIVPMILGKFEPEEVRFDLRPRLAAKGIEFLQGDVRAIDPVRRTVEIGRDRVDETLAFDHLIIAIGPRIGGAEIPGLMQFSHNILTIDGALRFRRAIEDFRSGSIVLGLCPGATLPVPTCELALALAEKFKRGVERGEVNIAVVFPHTLEKAFAGAALFRDIESEFNRAGIEMAADFAISKVDPSKITSSSGSSLPYDLLTLIPPLTTQFGLQDLGPVTDVSGFLEVNEHLQVAGAETIYAAGDVIALPGPRFGYMAIRQGKIAASNVLAELRGETTRTEYAHRIAWLLKEKYAGPTSFHYGVWDVTLGDFDDDALLGIAKAMRPRYGRLNIEGETWFAAA